MCRFGHLAVVVSLEFVEFCCLVAGHLHHAHHVGVFFVSPQHFEIAVPGDKNQRRGIGSNVEQRGKFVDDGLLSGDATLLTHRKVGDGVAAVGNQTGDAVRVNAVSGEISFVKIPDIISEALGAIESRAMNSLEDIIEADRLTRSWAYERFSLESSDQAH